MTIPYRGPRRGLTQDDTIVSTGYGETLVTGAPRVAALMDFQEALDEMARVAARYRVSIEKIVLDDAHGLKQPVGT